MFKKKAVSLIVLASLLLSTSLVGQSAFAASNPPKSASFFSNQKVALKNYHSLKEGFKKQFNSDDTYPDSYAGAYIDDNGNLNINLSDDGASIKSAVNDDRTIYHSVAFSNKQLNNAVKFLNNYLGKDGIVATEVDEKNDKVYVYLQNANDTSIVNQLVSNFPFVEIKQQKNAIKLTYTVYNGGGAVDGNESFSIGFGAKNNSTGQIGFVIPGHVGSAGSNVTYGGNSLGNVSSSYFGPNVDAAFVPRSNSSWTAVNYFYNSYTYSGTQNEEPQGAYLEKFGAYSYMTAGYVLSNNFSYTVNNINFTDMEKADYEAIQGDSGAPVTYWDGSNRYLVGTQSASNLGPNGEWIDGTSFSIFSKYKNIVSTLGVSAYHD